MIKLPFLFAGLALWLSSCVPSESDPLACRDGSCAHQSELTFCDIDRAYPDTVQPNECIAPPSADACNRVAACDDPAKPYCNDDSMGTCVECTDNTHCPVDGESCNTNTGECVDGIVIPCTPGAGGDEECAANAEGLDYCSDGGICAACLDNSHCTEFVNAGICDATAFECRACDVGGDDCESGLCGTRDEGVCVAEGDVIRVDGGNAGGDVGGCGAVGSECATIGFAIGQVGGTKNVIVVADGDYSEALSIAAGTVTIIGGRGVVVNPSLTDENIPALRVSGGATATILGISVIPASGTVGTDAVSCSGVGSSLTLSGVAVSNAEDIGVSASNCALTVSASTISNNDGGGISVNGGDFDITNNFIVENGALGNSAPAVSLAGSGTTLTFDFNTVARNLVANDLLTTGVACTLTNSLTGSGNIVYLGSPAASPPVSGTCGWDYSNIEADISGTENINQPPAFVNGVPPNGDYHLAPGSLCIDAADPAATLATDIDGEARPQGAAPDIGADEAE